MKLAAWEIRGADTGRPFTGAWIETAVTQNTLVPLLCRPFTGAWIETVPSAKVAQVATVAPSRGRGLKLKHRLSVKWKGASPLHGGVD